MPREELLDIEVDRDLTAERRRRIDPQDLASQRSLVRVPLEGRHEHRGSTGERDRGQPSP
jgi:hypothetical protein